MEKLICLLYRSVRNHKYVQKRNTLLYFAGIETQGIFEILQDTGNTFDQVITKLNEHFNVKKNIPYERSVFREAKQETN